MRFLRKQWKPFAMSAWVLACGAVVLSRATEVDRLAIPELSDDSERIRAVLNSAMVSPSYPYSQPPNVRLKLATSAAPEARITDASAHLFYPRVSKPLIDPSSLPLAPEIQSYTAMLPVIEATRTSSDHGRLCLEFQLPKTECFNTLRADIFRGLSANAMDLDHPFATVDIPDNRQPGAWLSFTDTNVEPKRTYYYRAQLRGQLPKVTSWLSKGASGENLCQYEIHPPTNGISKGKSLSGCDVFAADLSAVVAAESPSNFEIRFSGTSGKVPREGEPAELLSDYTGRFVVRVWIPDASDWKESTLELHAGDCLAGKVVFKKPKDAEFTSFRFDTGLVLEQIIRANQQKTATVREAVLDTNGAPKLDETTHQPMFMERTVNTSGIPRDVATLRDRETGKRHDYSK